LEISGKQQKLELERKTKRELYAQTATGQHINALPQRGYLAGDPTATMRNKRPTKLAMQKIEGED
jgi:hypothetical protein